MKILFGIQTTGNGHISRSREVVHRLRSRGHEVQVLFSGRDPSGLKEIEAFAPADHPVGLHWHHFGQPILPPIIPGHLDATRPVEADKVLVYLPFDHPDEVQTLLAPFTTHHFFIYGIAELSSPVDREHLHLRPYSRSGFLEDLEDCNGVICGAGFELAGEALQLGKKLLVKPLKGQFEQLSNALALEKLQLARVMKRLDRKAVQLWLELPPNAPAGYPDTAQLIAVWIENGRWEDIDRLSKKAWAQTGRVPRWDDR